MYINRTRHVLTIVAMLHHTVLLTKKASNEGERLKSSELFFFDFYKAGSIEERTIRIFSIYIYKSIIDEFVHSLSYRTL